MHLIHYERHEKIYVTEKEVERDSRGLRSLTELLGPHKNSSNESRLEATLTS